jgi:metal transporter CNNM
MAVVIPSDSDAGSSHYNTINSHLTQSLHWTAPTGKPLKIESSSDSDGQTLQFLEAAKANIEGRGHKILGIRSPTPIGIITFEDIIDTILQKTSRDEKDYFDRGHELPLTKTRKTGDCNLTSKLTLASLPKIFTPKSERAVVKKTPKGQGIRGKSVIADRAPNSYRNPDFQGAVRKRNVSKNEKIVTADGANDDYSHSSCTENSQGGFHGSESSKWCRGLLFYTLEFFLCSS